MKFDNYGLQLGLRIAVLFVALLGLAFAIAYQRENSLILILGVVIVATVVSIIRYTDKVVRNLSAFLGGFRHGEFQQKLTISNMGKRFLELETLLSKSAVEFQDLRIQQQQLANYFRSLVQHLPLPFLILHDDGRVEIMNMATRRTFNVADITSTTDLARFGASFQRDVMQIEAGQSVLASVSIEDTEEHYILTATSINMDGRTQKLVALQNIQEELDATELATWQNLLRVTSHEILNSLAPVSSCAQTAESLVVDVLANKVDDPQMRSDLEDIRDAVDTMARRSEGLMRFVHSYRQLTRMPPPKTRKIELEEYFFRLNSLLRTELKQKDITFVCELQPTGLSVLADEDMLDQVIINLVRNAADAVEGTTNGKIGIRAYIDGKQRVVLQVADNGPGIDAETAKNIFVPFFTTKSQGSGVGLALVRYIMLTHGGTALYAPGSSGGSVFRLIF
jgi:two-component system nitrogen regulation sensor histidine kinase NtrY